MFTYIHFKNYKSLENLKVDFTKKDDPKKLTIIYGENGAGKSNIVSGFYTLLDLCNTLSVNQLINSIFDDISNDSKLYSENEKKTFFEIVKKKRGISAIINSCKTVDSTDNMSLEYGFKINGKNGFYYIEFDNEKIVKEKLEFVVNKRRGCYFEINSSFKTQCKTQKRINSSIFLDKNYLIDINDKLDKYWGKHTFLSVIKNDIENKNYEYLESKMSSNFLDVIGLLFTVSCCFKDGLVNEKSVMTLSKPILKQLDRGEINKRYEKDLNKTEEFINEVFTGLYSDIKRVYYKREIDNEKIKYELIFKKLIGNKIINIDFSRESTGTMRILKILPYIYMALNGYVCVIDEIDMGIHDILIRDIINEVKRNISGQLILTTHNTLLLEEKNLKESFCFLVINSDGSKDVYNINDYDNRTHPNHNIRDLYLKGFYEAVPNTGYFNLEEITRKFNN